MKIKRNNKKNTFKINLVKIISILNIIIIVNMPYILLSSINSFYNYYLYESFLDFSNVYLLIISFIIVYLVFIILSLCTKSLKKSNIILLIIMFILLILNEIKLYYMDLPVYFSDILYLFNIGEIMSFTGPSFGSLIVSKYMFFIIQIVYFLMLFVILINCKDIKLYNIKRFYVFIPLIFLIILFYPSSYTNDFVLTKLLNSSDIKDYSYFTEDKDYYLSYGIISGMYIQLLEERVFEPKTYDSEVVEETLNKLENDSKTSDIKPNIILVFSESFWDVDKLNEITFDKEITPNFSKLMKKGKLIEMISPTYGGRSSNVEFELLTGGNTAFYNNAYIPYMRMYNNDSYYDKESIIKELKKYGYMTKILSTSSDKLYNCGQVYQYLKVDDVEYAYEVDEKYIKGLYPSDDFVADKIINEISTKKEKPLFYMALTMQAHMPYIKSKYEEYDIEITKSELNEEENEVMLSYAQGIYDADKQLGKLYEFISEYSEPTTIIFLGDHLPYLNTANGDNLIDKLDYFNTNDSLLNVFRKYNTQALIVSNYDIKYDDTKYLGPDILLPYVLQQNNINISEFYQYLLNTKDILPTFNRYIAIDNDSNLYYTNRLHSDMLETYNMRNNIQYHFFNK